MAANGKDIFGDGKSPADNLGPGEQNADAPNFDDLFGGGDQTRQLLGNAESTSQKPQDYVTDLEKELDRYEKGHGKTPKWRIPLMYAALGALAIVLVLILANPLPKIGSAQTEKPTAQRGNPAPAQTTAPKPAPKPTPAAATQPDDTADPENTTAAPHQPVSWQVAHELFVDGQYDRAVPVYEKLKKRIKPETQNGSLLDVIDLQIGLCNYYLDRENGVTDAFTSALQSQSPAIQAIASYYVAFIEFKNENFLSAREHAYRTLSLFEVLRDHFPSVVEKDCYFLIANALASETIALSNANIQLPGSSWAESMTPYHLPTLDQQGLESLLEKGREAMAEAAMGPAIKQKRDAGLTQGTFSAIAQDAPADEFLAKYANYQNYEINWHESAADFKARPINLYLPTTIEQKIPEYAAGSAGLIVKNDTQALTVYNPRTYISLAFHKRLLANESMAVLRHFMHRYPQDPRIANAHFALAAVYSVADQKDVAIGEYKLVASRFADSELAPYALLYSSRIRTDMKDYTGARKDLSSIVLQYPEARICDQAYMYLAQATMRSGIYEEAADLFAKVYNLNMTPRARARAAYGAAMCSYETARFSDAEEWFTRCFKDYTDDPQIDPGELYYTLAHTKFALGKYEDATTAFRLALTGRLDRQQYANVILSWADTMIEHGDYAEALNILAAPGHEDLTLEQSCRVIQTQAHIYRKIDLPNRAINLLSRKIEFLANAELRGELLVELARNYLASGEPAKARDELLAALDDLSEGSPKVQATLELADLCVNTDENDQAVQLCLDLLKTPLPQTSRKQALSILGTAYRNKKLYDKAAMAFAGVVNNGTETQ